MKHEDIAFTGLGDRAADRTIQREANQGKWVRVAEGIYVANNGRPVEEIVCGKWAPILAYFAPGAVVTGRTAMRRNAWRERGEDGRPTFPGWVFATHSEGTSRKRISLPGLEIRSVPGPGPLEDDMPFLGVRLPSEARRLLDNLKTSRSKGGPSRTVGREAVELEIERLLKSDREEGLRAIRTRAEQIAPLLGAENELKELLDIIGTVLGTRQVKLQSKEVAARRRIINPYDPDCLERLKLLASGLGRITLPTIPDPHVSADARAGVSFIEAYFTNYIEGTRFLVDKARRIVFEGDEPDGRPADGRDVTQTFAQVSRFVLGDKTATTFQEFRDEIKERNRMLLDARPDKAPGEFKEEANSAGNTVFVMPNLVEGTLREGFEMLGGIVHPFARGLFLHTLLVLVHPFNDGNGRTSRIMMTKELVGAGQARAIVPTIYRSDYIGGLRALTNPTGMQAAPLVRAMIRCQDITSRIVSDDLSRMIDLWASTHAFLEDERGAQLTSPDPTAEIIWRNGIPAPAKYWQDLDLEAQLTADDDLSSVFGSFR